ncbi:MAG: hypothetical protein ACE5JR_11125 [Gemmatimonadota bacterium]
MSVSAATIASVLRGGVFLVTVSFLVPVVLFDHLGLVLAASAGALT